MSQILSSRIATLSERSFFWGFFYYFRCTRGNEVFGLA